MNEAIKITASGDALEYLRKLGDPSVVLKGLLRTMDKQNQLSVSYIQRNYMSLPGDGPTSSTSTRVHTNRLRSSMRASQATLSGDGIVSAIGSNVVYAAILEEGGTTKPHVIRPRNKKALAFGGKCYVQVNHPGSRFEGRHFTRRGIEDRLGDYTAAFAETIVKLS